MSNEIGDVRPTALKHLIGQRGVLDQVTVVLDAAFADGKKLDRALLVGPPGLGKSQTAFVIAQEMATGFHEVLGQAVTAPADLNALLLGAQDKDVIHFDECHELSKEYQTTLYLARHPAQDYAGWRAGKSVQSVPLADVTTFGSVGGPRRTRRSFSSPAAGYFTPRGMVAGPAPLPGAADSTRKTTLANWTMSPARSGPAARLPSREPLSQVPLEFPVGDPPPGGGVQAAERGILFIWKEQPAVPPHLEWLEERPRPAGEPVRSSDEPEESGTGRSRAAQDGLDDPTPPDV